MVWNDDASSCSDPQAPISAGGGGVSIYTPQPTWQAGTIGGVAIPASGGKRMVPDIALTASPYNAPFAFCTSDPTFWNTAANGGTPPYQQASCNDGLRDASSQLLTVGGGTSFDAPTFSGLVAILNQAKGYSAASGQGVVNSTLYSLAATPVYATAFHDITSGGNQCLSGTSYCASPGTTHYAATTGYDEASGLGSIDFFNLLTAWPSSGTTTSGAPSFGLAATSVSLAPGASTTGTLTITPTNGYTGTVDLKVTGSLTDGCIVLGSSSVPVTGTAPANATYTVYTNSSACTTAGAARPGTTAVARNAAPPAPSPWKRLPLPATLAGAFVLVCARRRSRKFLGGALALGLLLTLSLTGLGLTGCSGGSSTSNGTGSTTTTTTTNSPAGTYTITITGTDSATSTLTSTASFTVTVT